MKIPSVWFALMFSVIPGCRKQEQSPPGPAQTATGYLRYYTIAVDGPGLYYEKDIPADAKDSSVEYRILLLSDNKGGYIVDGDGVEASFHNYIDQHSLLRYRETGKKGCTSSSIANYCPLTDPIVDTIGFTIIP